MGAVYEKYLPNLYLLTEVTALRWTMVNPDALDSGSMANAFLFTDSDVEAEQGISRQIGLWNSIISTPGSRYMCLDIESFYLGTPMVRFKYMKIPIDVFPPATIAQYNLHQHTHNGFVYLEVRKAIYGLPQAGILANQLLRKRLRPFGYYEVAHTPGLWKHVTRPIQFTLTVDDFGIKYDDKEHADHLIQALKTYYKLKEDWDGALY